MIHILPSGKRQEKVSQNSDLHRIHSGKTSCSSSRNKQAKVNLHILMCLCLWQFKNIQLFCVIFIVLFDTIYTQIPHAFSYSHFYKCLFLPPSNNLTVFFISISLIWLKKPWFKESQNGGKSKYKQPVTDTGLIRQSGFEKQLLSSSQMQEAAGKERKTKNNKKKQNTKTQDNFLHPKSDEEGSPVY